VSIRGVSVLVGLKLSEEVVEGSQVVCRCGGMEGIEHSWDGDAEDEVVLCAAREFARGEGREFVEG
jgi:hypothetical protein